FAAPRADRRARLRRGRRRVGLPLQALALAGARGVARARAMSAGAVARIVARVAPEAAERRLLDAGIAPVLARLYAARGIDDPARLSRDLAKLLPPQPMKGIGEAARLVADAIDAGERLCIVADYDCDGATACAVAVRG